MKIFGHIYSKNSDRCIFYFVFDYINNVLIIGINLFIFPFFVFESMYMKVLGEKIISYL